MMMAKSIPVSASLIALALGYIVCYLANKEQKALKTLGVIIGTVIIILSSMLILIKLTWGIANLSKVCGKMKPYHRMMMKDRMPSNMPAQAPQK